MEHEKPAMRRIIGAAQYIINGEEIYYPKLSCGHIEATARKRALIAKDVVRRRRVVCTECMSDF